MNGSENPVQEFLNSVFKFEAELPSPQEIFLAILLSFGLSFLVAAVYRRTYKGTQYSQDYVHTLMILGIVVSVIIMVVRGNAAMAFGLFAAFSIIRFRSTVPQARDIAFIFFAMAAGLAVGARQYQLAVITTIVIAAIIYIISRLDLFAPRRASHYLRARVTNDIDYDTVFEPLFDQFVERRNLISVESIQAGMMTELRWGLLLKDGIKPGQLVQAIQQVNGNNRVLLTSAMREIPMDPE